MNFIRSLLLLMAFSTSCLHLQAMNNNNANAEKRKLFGSLYPAFKTKQHRDSDSLNYEYFTAILHQEKTTISQAPHETLLKSRYKYPGKTEKDTILHAAVRLAKTAVEVTEREKAIAMIALIMERTPELCNVKNNKQKLPKDVIPSNAQQEDKELIEDILGTVIDVERLNEEREKRDKEQREIWEKHHYNSDC